VKNPLSSSQGGYAQVNTMLSTSSNDLIEKQQNEELSSKLKSGSSVYLFL
jgi:hypothetical protein